MSFHKNITGRGLHEPGQYKVKNSTGSTISKASTVRRVGFDTVPTVELITSPATQEVFGIVTDDIPDGCIGYVASEGVFGEFDTTSWVAEDVLYATAAGGLSTTVLGGPIATVLTSDASDGKLLVNTRTADNTTAVGGHVVETLVVTPTDITNGYVTLGTTPTTPTETVLLVKGLATQHYGDDFTISGNQLSWISVNPGDLGFIIGSGDKFTVFIK